MRRFRWDLVLAALILAGGIVLGAVLPRYEWHGQLDRSGTTGVFDRWTGEYCTAIDAGFVCVDIREQAAQPRSGGDPFDSVWEEATRGGEPYERGDL